MRRVDLADLVEEQRAAVGQLEAAAAPLRRAGERALLVAEQLALQQGVATAPRSGPGRTGPCARGLSRWMAWATSSLPVPLSPWISTVARVGADLPDRVEHLLHRGRLRR